MITRMGADRPTRITMVPFCPPRPGVSTVRTGIETVGGWVADGDELVGASGSKVPRGSSASAA